MANANVHLVTNRGNQYAVTEHRLTLQWGDDREDILILERTELVNKPCGMKGFIEYLPVRGEASIGGLTEDDFADMCAQYEIEYGGVNGLQLLETKFGATATEWIEDALIAA